MKVLVADDDVASRKVITRVLEKLGYDVTAVCDGLAAWECRQRPAAPRWIGLSDDLTLHLASVALNCKRAGGDHSSLSQVDRERVGGGVMQMEAQHITARRQVRDAVRLPAKRMTQGIACDHNRVFASEAAHPSAIAIQNLHVDLAAGGIGVQLEALHACQIQGFEGDLAHVL